jgi:hypothetical protein
MPFAHGDTHSLVCEKRAAGKAADARTDDYCVEII